MIYFLLKWFRKNPKGFFRGTVGGFVGGASRGIFIDSLGNIPGDIQRRIAGRTSKGALGGISKNILKRIPGGTLEIYPAL